MNLTASSYRRPPIRVAIFGCGRAVYADHYPFFREHPALFEVVAACDMLRDRRDEILKDFPKAKMFRQFGEMLDEREIDLVDIATCTPDHVKHAMMSLKRGFWTLLESPMALTLDDAVMLRGQAVKTKNRLIVFNRGAFAPDYLLAKQAIGDPRLGEIHQIRIRREDFVRRDDWQTVKRLGGGAAWYAMPDLMIQAVKLLREPPFQMWSELRRIASLGDAEDECHVALKTRGTLTADIEYNGGSLPGATRSPAFEIVAERGTFRVAPGASEGTLRVIEPGFKFPRRRSSVRTPPIKDLHETFPVVDIPVRLPPGTPRGLSAFWKCVYDTVRRAVPFPLALEDSLEAVKLSALMKRTSPFGMTA